MKKKNRKVVAGFLTFNVKLQSNERTGHQAYEELLSTMYRNKIIGSPKRGNSLILRTQFSTEILADRIIYGKLSRFTKLDTKDWLNIDNLERSDYDLPPHLFPNLKETDYYFFSRAHRFCVRIKTGMPSALQIQEFLKNALSQCIDFSEQIIVTIEQSSETFERILNAPAVKSIEISISYTNQDITEDTEEFVDNLLRDMNAGNVAFKISPDHNERLSVHSRLLRGAILLARSNGKVIANITNDENKHEKINTAEHPKVFQITAESEDHVLLTIYNKIMSIFRP